MKYFACNAADKQYLYPQDHGPISCWIYSVDCQRKKDFIQSAGVKLISSNRGQGAEIAGQLQRALMCSLGPYLFTILEKLVV